MHGHIASVVRGKGPGEVSIIHPSRKLTNPGNGCGPFRNLVSACTTSPVHKQITNCECRTRLPIVLHTEGVLYRTAVEDTIGDVEDKILQGTGEGGRLTLGSMLNKGSREINESEGQSAVFQVARATARNQRLFHASLS